MATPASQPTALERAILSTIVYFDMFAYPLTLMELWRWCIAPDPEARRATLSDIDTTLRTSNFLHSRIESESGMYMLKGKKALVRGRLDRYALSGRRWNILLRFTRAVRWIPFVELVAACNTFALNDFHEGSDIDVFIVVRKGRLWMMRLAVTAVTWFLRLWRHGGRIADHICLSFFVTDDVLNLEPIAKGNDSDNDWYLIFWIAFLVPVFNPHGVFEKVWQENVWARASLPHAFPISPAPARHRVTRGPMSRAFVRMKEWGLGGFLGNGVERMCRALERRKMKQKLATIDPESSDVIVSDRMLKFHEVDGRSKIKKEFADRLAEIFGSSKA